MRESFCLTLFALKFSTHHAKRNHLQHCRYFWRLRAGWAAFRQAQDRQRQKALLHGSMARVYHQRLLGEVLAAWRGPFLLKCRARRLSRARAALAWKLSILRRALFAWQEVRGMRLPIIFSIQHNVPNRTGLAILRCFQENCDVHL